VDLTALTDEDLATFTARQRAIEMYVQNPQLSMKVINQHTGVDPKTVYRLIERCLKNILMGQFTDFAPRFRMHASNSMSEFILSIAIRSPGLWACGCVRSSATALSIDRSVPPTAGKTTTPRYWWCSGGAQVD
jgi:hypothetical protein